VTTYLLVHGAWQGAWVWADTVDALTRRGIGARAFDLPGSGNDSTPAGDVSLDSYVQSILRQAQELDDSEIVLVGHSMGGAAVTAAAATRPDLFSTLVYVCAFVPQTGESVGQLSQKSHALGAKGPQVRPVNGGVAVELIPEDIAEIFLHDCPPSVAPRVLSKFRPQPTKPLGEPFGDLDAVAAIPKTYVRCALDRAVAPDLQTMMAAGAGITDVRTLVSGHEPFFSQPDALLDVLLSVQGHDVM
jgi:pimeloyl-ACP methyl ester carboxylesterase